MTSAAQLLIDVLAVVGAWHLGGTVTRAILYRRQRRKAPNLKPYGALPAPWQYRPGAFESDNAHNREE